MLLEEKLCGDFGASLTDSREVVSEGVKSRVLVFSRFYIRCASLLGLAVVLTEGDGFCEVAMQASCGRKDAPIVGDMGAAADFCREARKALDPFVIP